MIGLFAVPHIIRVFIAHLRGEKPLVSEAHVRAELPSLKLLFQNSWLMTKCAALGTGIGAIPGDFELVEAGMAFCIFAFLPFCTVTGGHASVDVFTNFLPRTANRVLEVLISILFAVVLVVIAVQLEQGMARKISSGQTTLLLQFPVWWAYAISLAGAVVTAVIGVYMAFVRIYELMTGRVIAPNAVGADH